MTSCIVHHIYMMNNTFFRLDILQKKKKRFFYYRGDFLVTQNLVELEVEMGQAGICKGKV